MPNARLLFFQQFPYPDYVVDNFILLIQSVMALIFVLAYMYTAVMIVKVCNFVYPALFAGKKNKFIEYLQHYLTVNYNTSYCQLKSCNNVYIQQAGDSLL